MATNQKKEEWEEEDTMVIVELSGILDEDFITKGSGDCKVLGIDTDRPMLQLDRYTFTGQYEDTLGTNLMFQQGPVSEPQHTSLLDTIENNSPLTTSLNYVCKVDKKLVMSRVFITKNEEEVIEDAVPGPSGVVVEDELMESGDISSQADRVKGSETTSENICSTSESNIDVVVMDTADVSETNSITTQEVPNG